MFPRLVQRSRPSPPSRSMPCMCTSQYPLCEDLDKYMHICSGELLISFNRGRGAVGAERGEVWRTGLDHLSRKKCGNFNAVAKRQKTRTVIGSLGTAILRLNGETKLTKTLQKLYKKIHGQTKGGEPSSNHPPPKYTTVVHVCATVGHFISVSVFRRVQRLRILTGLKE